MNIVRNNGEITLPKERKPRPRQRQYGYRYAGKRVQGETCDPGEGFCLECGKKGKFSVSHFGVGNMSYSFCWECRDRMSAKLVVYDRERGIGAIPTNLAMNKPGLFQSWPPAITALLLAAFALVLLFAYGCKNSSRAPLPSQSGETLLCSSTDFPRPWPRRADGMCYSEDGAAANGILPAKAGQEAGYCPDGSLLKVQGHWACNDFQRPAMK